MEYPLYIGNPVEPLPRVVLWHNLYPQCKNQILCQSSDIVMIGTNLSTMWQSKNILRIKNNNIYDKSIMSYHCPINKRILLFPIYRTFDNFNMCRYLHLYLGIT